MKLMTPESAAEVLAISRSTVLRMIADGALPAICLRAGRRKKVWRIRQEVLEKWVISKEKETTRRGAHASAPEDNHALKSNSHHEAALARQANAN